ncbi:hypothetical protein ElyMa_000475000 [Elysia marginata]|uniref:Uncharacterized protein n=1 Tax=Elysia marginata TaxID=1093978 RepID=A0AAV4FTL7_9GAST|nr:hypothetical protein ElyMa_000475000 [Elysia marginata]
MKFSPASVSEPITRERLKACQGSDLSRNENTCFSSFPGGPDGILGNTRERGQRGRVVSASDSRSGGRGFDSQPCHVAIGFVKQFTLTVPSPPPLKWVPSYRQFLNL